MTERHLNSPADSLLASPYLSSQRRNFVTTLAVAIGLQSSQ